VPDVNVLTVQDVETLLVTGLFVVNSVVME